jgi:hypothetical protein
MRLIKIAAYLILIILLSSCQANKTISGKGTATIVKANGKVKQRQMKKVKCVKKRLRVEKRNHNRRNRTY